MADDSEFITKLIGFGLAQILFIVFIVGLIRR
jgi:hypothetical protein